MARRARARIDRLNADTTVPASPHVQRQLPFFDVIDDETLAVLDAQVDWLIENVGIEFRDDPLLG